jgi:two-component system chemotaxis response regulator CheY
MKTEVEADPRKRNETTGRKSIRTHIRALVVEDDPAMGTLIKGVLESAEIETVMVVTGEDAVTKFQQQKYDVILLDVEGLPERGTILAREVRKSGFNRNTPVVIISDDKRPSALTESFQAGASFFVYKPLDKAHLMRLVRVTQGTIENEKRRFRRVAVRGVVTIKGSGKTEGGETIDLSLNGALIRTQGVFPPGSKVELTFSLHTGADPVVGKGTVRRIVEGNQIGIQFDGLSPMESGRLQDYLLTFITD